MSNKIHRIVLTGGPCGGKTTAMSSITDRLRSLGYNVYVVPEAATLFILGGVCLNDPNDYRRMQIQGTMMKAIIHLEDSFHEMAKASDRPAVILYDRGIMDSKAFTSEHMWQALLDENNWSLVGLRDKRYDAVIHLVSAAVGAEEFYTLANNAARSETPAQAAALDLKIRNAWIGHSHLRVIDNKPDFADKIRDVIAAVCNVVGAPEPIENERKFLVDDFSFPDNVKHEKVKIEQTYLLSTEGVARVRKRGQYGSYSYTHTIKKFLAGGSNVEIERMISSREYFDLLSQADPSRDVVFKDRICFLWENQYFELDIFQAPRNNLVILEAELEKENAKITIPPFIKVIREVTDEKEFSNAEIARKNS